MEYQINISGTAAEMAKVLALLAQGNVEAASAFEAQPDIKPAQEPDPAQMAALNLETGSFEFPPQDEPPIPVSQEVTVADLQAVGRKLAVAGKGAVVQQVLAQYGVKLISRIPPEKRAEALAALQKEV